MFEIFNTCSGELVKHLGNEADQHNQVVDFQDAYERYTMAVIASKTVNIILIARD
jgi:regulator of extracellular matrix RemA (YlzA/DUF370 family)